MLKLTILFICLLVFICIQAIGTYIQVQQYKKAVRRLHKKGNIGIGSRRSKIKNNIVIIACDNDGKIIDGEFIEGITIFTKFKQIPDIVGKNVFSLKEEYESLSKKEQKFFRGHLQAVDALCNRLASINDI